MKRSGLFWKLFFVHGGLLIALIASFSVVLFNWNHAAVTNAARARLSGIAAVVRNQFETDLAEYRTDTLRPDTLKTDALNTDELRTQVDELARASRVRISLIAPDGTVIADSDEDPSAMQNHINRPDLLAARVEGFGENIRRSPTLGRRMQYYSLTIRRNGELLGFVRVSIDEPAFGEEAWPHLRALWLLGLATLVTIGWASHFRAKSMTADLQRLVRGAQAMGESDFEPPLAIRSGDAIEGLADALSQARAKLARRIAALEDHNETMATVLGGMVEGVLAVDAEKHILFANAASLALLQRKDPVAGRPLLEVVRNVEIEAVVAEALQGDATRQREIELPGPPRRTLNVLATQWASATKPGVVVVMHDVTALRRLENMRRDFAANVSHELKTPLASIKAYAETLRMGAINDAEHNLGFVERISEEAERLHQLIADILHLARVESGIQAFEMAAVDVGMVVQRCIDQQRPLADRQEVSLTIEPPQEASAVWADSDGLFTMLTNLLSNAVKYTPRGGRVTVRWFRRDEDMVIEVQDTGIGIAPAEQQRVFERFYRVDRARSREFGGTGLGLAIVKHLAQSFGGSVGLESELQRGSTFRVVLPLSKR